MNTLLKKKINFPWHRVDIFYLISFVYFLDYLILSLSFQEHLFDVSDLQHEPPLISKCGSLEVTFTYEASKSKMTITVHKAREIPAKDRGGANNTQVIGYIMRNYCDNMIYNASVPPCQISCTLTCDAVRRSYNNKRQTKKITCARIWTCDQ